MISLFVSFSFALLLTTMFAFRLRLWDRPWLLATYFTVFMSLEVITQHYFLPPDVFGIEIGILFLALSFVFIGITAVARRIESRLDE
ncbi:MAG: hypothetical protein JRC77_01245 [Deltaproteobacteria bacterium]|nr:hypothetical protein [Deltaproteobacteria bacterium]